LTRSWIETTIYLLTVNGYHSRCEYANNYTTLAHIKIRDFSGYFGKWHFVCLGIFHRQKSNLGKFTLCSYSINIDVIVCFFLFITTLRTSIQCHVLALDTLFCLRANQSLSLLFTTMCLVEKLADIRFDPIVDRNYDLLAHRKRPPNLKS
jgi:hypothetical protein